MKLNVFDKQASRNRTCSGDAVARKRLIKSNYVIIAIMVLLSSCNADKSKDGQTHVRHLPLKGGFNFRDLGGYRTTDGKTVKWGKVFRSDEMHNLTQADLDYLNQIPLHTVVDFRSEGEIKSAPDKIPPSVKTRFELIINPGSHSSSSNPGVFGDDAGEVFMEELNRSFITDPVIIDQYKTFFGLLQDEKNVPLLFHCTAGKDRTGMGAALFLASLGVDEQTIFEDYLLSNRYLEKKYKAITDSIPSLKALFEVRLQYLQAGFDQIKKDHESVENFLQNTLCVDLKRMRQLYLNP